MVNSHLLLPILEFSKSVLNVMELFRTIFEAECPFTLFLHEHLRRLIISLIDHFVHPAVLESTSSTKKLMIIDLSIKENLLPDESIDVGFGTTKALIENSSIPWSPKFQKGGSKFYGKVDQKAQETISFEVFSELNFFVVWLTDKRRLALFPAGTTFRDPHHRKSPTRWEEGLNQRRTWVQT